MHFQLGYAFEKLGHLPMFRQKLHSLGSTAVPFNWPTFTSHTEARQVTSYRCWFTCKQHMTIFTSQPYILFSLGLGPVCWITGRTHWCLHMEIFTVSRLSINSFEVWEQILSRLLSLFNFYPEQVRALRLRNIQSSAPRSGYRNAR